MTYNYIRFGSIFEFGHNYLPEFLNSPKGQFDPSYIMPNLKSLVYIPKIGTDGAVDFPRFNGMSVFLCFPIIVFSLYYAATGFGKRAVRIGLLCAALHILLIASHKTMGGYHFGNRYFADVMPCLFFILLFAKGSKKLPTLAMPLFVMGMSLNTAGVIYMIANM